MADHIVWSFSGLKTFLQCPKKYYHLKVAKDVADTTNEAAHYGTSFHLVAEEYMRDGKEIPPEFKQYEAFLQNLRVIEGEKLCEVKLGLTREYQPCEFSAPDVWWHGIADLVILNEAKGYAYSVDYKTSKSSRYADLKQLDLVAAAIFAKYPKINKIKSALAFVVCNELVKKTHFRDMMENYLAQPAREVRRIEVAMETGVWNPVKNGLCKNYCPVKECIHCGD